MALTNFKIKAFFQAIAARILLNRINTFFFVFSLLYCLTQGIIQSLLYSGDNDHKALLTVIVEPLLPPGNMTFVTGSPGNFHLQMCNDVPYNFLGLGGQPIYPCSTVFHSSLHSANPSPSKPSETRTFDWSDGLEVFTARSLEGSSSVDGVLIHPLPRNDTVPLSLQCVQNLSYPKQLLSDATREDLALIALQFWLFAISAIAVINDSVPHLMTAIVTRVTLTAWAAFSLWRTTRDSAMFQEILAKPGTPCSLDLLSGYYRRRLSFQIGDLVVSCTALFVFVYLSTMLLKAYSSLAFRCVGAPAHINRINKFFLALLSVLQLEVFVLTTSMAMWIDVLLNTAIGNITPLMKTYIAVFITTLLVILPWITMGWFASKREKTWMMPAFLFIGFLILLAWLVMFYSIVYRWTFLQWPFLGCFTVSSLVLLVASFVLGVICRMHFGKGHAEYLRAEEALSSNNFTREVFTRNERRDSFDLTPVSLDRKASLGSEKQAVSIYYVQTLESDGGGGIQSLPPTHKGPFSHV